MYAKRTCSQLKKKMGVKRPKSLVFSNFTKMKIFSTIIYENSVIHKPSFGLRDVFKMCVRSVQPF